MFRTCELVVINKLDLLPYLEFDLDRLLYNLDAVNPGVRRLQVSARTGEGVDEFREWLLGLCARADVNSPPPLDGQLTSNGAPA
jgi:hydrogenase nickel incorporation protein HypB